MKLIKQYCYLDDQTDFSEIGIKKFIEKQAKTCYQSTHTITEDSYEKTEPSGVIMMISHIILIINQMLIIIYQRYRKQKPNIWFYQKTTGEQNRLDRYCLYLRNQNQYYAVLMMHGTIFYIEGMIHTPIQWQGNQQKT